MEQSMAQVEAQMKSIKAEELEIMAREYAAEAMESAFNAEEMAKMAEEETEEAMKIAKKAEAFMKELKSEMVKDGYLKTVDDIEELKFEDGKVLLNGKPVKEKDAKKYYEIRKKHLGEDSELLWH